ncbi:MAG: heterodisulfide reductase-related iron-sulfur binding cluster [Candidatus Hadarchaeales archaeon]
MELWFFRGCMSTFREREIAEATVEILRRLGLPFRLFDRETCCGSVLFRTGQVGEAEEVRKKNEEEFSRLGVRRLLTACPGCYSTFRKEYSLPGVEVLHLTQLLRDMVRGGRLRLGERKVRATYHDSCHLGREWGLYEEPREVLKSVPGLELVEMSLSRGFSRCCGAGGGVRSAFRELSSAVSSTRVGDALEAGAQLLVTSCPFCYHHLREVADGRVEVRDLSLLVRDLMEG